MRWDGRGELTIIPIFLNRIIRELHIDTKREILVFEWQQGGSSDLRVRGNGKVGLVESTVVPSDTEIEGIFTELVVV